MVAGEDVEVSTGGKEVHVDDVAEAIRILLSADDIAGEAFACYDQYISEFKVATIAKEISGSSSKINGTDREPKHEIVTDKIRKLGMEFGGDDRLRATIESMVSHLKARS